VSVEQPVRLRTPQQIRIVAGYNVFKMTFSIEADEPINDK